MNEVRQIVSEMHAVIDRVRHSEERERERKKERRRREKEVDVHIYKREGCRDLGRGTVFVGVNRE